MCLAPALDEYRVYKFNQGRHKSAANPGGFCYALAIRWLKEHDDVLGGNAAQPTDPEELDRRMHDADLIDAANRSQAGRRDFVRIFMGHKADAQRAGRGADLLSRLDARGHLPAPVPAPQAVPDTAQGRAAARGRQQLVAMRNYDLAGAAGHLGHVQAHTLAHIQDDRRDLDGETFFAEDLRMIEQTFAFDPVGASRVPLAGFDIAQEMGQERRCLLSFPLAGGGRGADHTVAIFRTVGGADGPPRAILFDPNYGEFRMPPDRLVGFCRGLAAWYNGVRKLDNEEPFDQCEVIRIGQAG